MPVLTPYRWAIYFRDWTEEKARQYPAAFRRLDELVKPFRQSLTGQIHQDCFWKFWDLRPGLMREVAAHDTMLASAIVTKYITFRRVPSRYIYTTKTILYFMYTWWEFAVLQSTIHQEWAFWTCGTLGASTLNYSTSYALETWPMPTLDASEELERLGEQYHAHRELLMVREQIGLTELYNNFHERAVKNPQIEAMRELHYKMNVAVAHAYGWTDIDLGLDFRDVGYLPANDRVRLTVSEEARVELLRRLTDLNLERHAQEAASGARQGSSQGRTKRTAHGGQGALALIDAPEA